VIPAIIRKVHHAKVRHEPSVPVWGTGTPRREFLFVDDLADGCIRLMELGYDGPFVNIGSGTDVTIRELVETVMDVVGYTGSIEFDATKPDGTPRKLMDVSRMHALGWTATTSLRDGLRIAYDDFLARHMEEAAPPRAAHGSAAPPRAAWVDSRAAVRCHPLPACHRSSHAPLRASARSRRRRCRCEGAASSRG
jgi:dTDP-D-glucose 4,6-dehydratase